MGSKMSSVAGGQAMASWPPAGNTYPLATFAGGCFWGLELAFQRQPGVVATAVGYTAGKVENPTYRQVCGGRTGHAEAVQLAFNPKEVSYDQLCSLFFGRHDPTTLNRQGNDVGTQYRSGIYYHDEEQQQVAEQHKKAIPGAATEVAPAGKFWPAEAYHQQYLQKGGQCADKGCGDRIRCYG